jgi:hypothetical protein
MDYKNQGEQFKRIGLDTAKDFGKVGNRAWQQSQEAGFNAIGEAVTGLRRVKLAGLVVGAAQSAAFLSQLTVAEQNEKVWLKESGEHYSPFVWDSLVLKRPEYDGNDKKDIELVTALLSVNRERVIVKKYLKGKETSHKQFLTKGDCIVTVAGKFVKKGHLLPFEKIKDLDYVLSSEVSLDYDCRFLFECFNIDKLVCDGRPKYYQIEGSENEFGFEFTLVSD